VERFLHVFDDYFGAGEELLFKVREKDRGGVG
jgi:hypothetical protein